MMDHPMSWALAGKMTVEVILVVVAYGLFVWAIARSMAWLGKKYPKISVTHEEYYGVEPYSEADDYSDAVEGTEPPRAA